jgi:hypothetical protein
MNSHTTPHDDFYTLLQTQKLAEVPSFLEEKIMQKIEVSNAPQASVIRLKSIFVFGLMSSVYVLLSLWISYYAPFNGTV